MPHNLAKGKAKNPPDKSTSRIKQDTKQTPRFFHSAALSSVTMAAPNTFNKKLVTHDKVTPDHVFFRKNILVPKAPSGDGLGRGIMSERFLVFSGLCQLTLQQQQQ